MIGMLNIYHLRHDSLQIDCTMNLFRQQTCNKIHALCNCSNANMQSENDQTKTHLQKRMIKLAKHR